MMKRLVASLLLLACPRLPAQDPGNGSVAAPSAIAQIRRSVVFIDLTCEKDGKTYNVHATGFLVQYPEPRIPSGSFSYLVTNRHAAMCWDDDRVPMKVESVSVKLNLKSESAVVHPLSAHGNASWFLPSDESVDLAVLSFLPNPHEVDYLTCPLSYFVGRKDFAGLHVSEGAKILFSGYFYQFPGKHRMQPIVREGVLAMIPDEQLVNTTGKLGNVYLGDVHVFGGNSGSPVFVDASGDQDGFIGFRNYRLLGVISGLFYEDQDFNLKAATMFKGTMHANSGIALIVPADELRKLLDEPQVQAQRDADVRRINGH
jgi:hypothetical protein